MGTLAAGVTLGGLMLAPDELGSLPVDRSVFLPGRTTDGHYQIELACDACHTERFGDRASMQSACIECHGAELVRADDSHPKSKFTDPRNADRVEILDARLCITCHQEHRPEITGTMGLSLPGDYCYRCHEGIGEDRPTHADLPFDGCASSGCHNFHDNRALYEDFLVEHRDEPALHRVARLAHRDPATLAERAGLAPRPPLGRDDHDAPPDTPDLEGEIDAWATSAHARGGVNCSGCHVGGDGAWRDPVPITRCAECHDREHEGFTLSRHGMRLAAGLTPMHPDAARLPMADDANAELDCQACHGAHAYDTQRAAAEACLQCHADEHTLAWRSSPHGRLWTEELEGRGAPGTGVSCASCHLPRVEAGGALRVEHNQNDTLRPREKMIRPTCMACHGLPFALDALADPALVATNYRGRPSRKVESIHFAAELRWELEGRPPPFAPESRQKEREEE